MYRTGKFYTKLAVPDGVTFPTHTSIEVGSLFHRNDEGLLYIYSGEWRPIPVYTGNPETNDALRWNGNYWVSSGFDTLIVGVGENYTEIERDGNIEFHGDATVWDDLRFPVQALNPPGAASDPDRDTDDGTFLFDKGSIETLMGVAQTPHSWKLESTLYPHVHWCPTDTDTGSVVWRFEYDIAKKNGTFSGSYTVTSTVRAAGGVAEKHLLTGFSGISMSGYDDISTIIKFRISRVGSDGSDDYDADARLLEFDIHYEMDATGSRQELTK